MPQDFKSCTGFINRWFGKAVKKPVKKDLGNPVYLRERAKELFQVTHYWRYTWRSLFKCFGVESAKIHAGFDDAEKRAIRLQLERDFEEERKKDPSYVQNSSNILKSVEKSWTAYFWKINYARREAGFFDKELDAIDAHRNTIFNFPSIKKEIPKAERPPPLMSNRRYAEIAASYQSESKELKKKPGQKS